MQPSSEATVKRRRGRPSKAQRKNKEIFRMQAEALANNNNGEKFPAPADLLKANLLNSETAKDTHHQRSQLEVKDCDVSECRLHESDVCSVTNFLEVSLKNGGKRRAPKSIVRDSYKRTKCKKAKKSNLHVGKKPFLINDLLSDTNESSKLLDCSKKLNYDILHRDPYLDNEVNASFIEKSRIFSLENRFPNKYFDVPFVNATEVNSISSMAKENYLNELKQRNPNCDSFSENLFSSIYFDKSCEGLLGNGNSWSLNSLFKNNHSSQYSSSLGAMGSNCFIRDLPSFSLMHIDGKLSDVSMNRDWLQNVSNSTGTYECNVDESTVPMSSRSLVSSGLSAFERYSSVTNGCNGLLSSLSAVQGSKSLCMEPDSSVCNDAASSSAAGSDMSSSSSHSTEKSSVSSALSSLSFSLSQTSLRKKLLNFFDDDASLSPEESSTKILNMSDKTSSKNIWQSLLQSETNQSQIGDLNRGLLSKFALLSAIDNLSNDEDATRNACENNLEHSMTTEPSKIKMVTPLDSLNDVRSYGETEERIENNSVLPSVIGNEKLIKPDEDASLLEDDRSVEDLGEVSPENESEESEWSLWMERLRCSHATRDSAVAAEVEKTEDYDDIDKILLSVRETFSQRRFSDDENSSARVEGPKATSLVQVRDDLGRQGDLVRCEKAVLHQEPVSDKESVIHKESMSHEEPTRHREELIVSTLGWSEPVAKLQELSSAHMLHWSYCRMTNHLLDPTRESFKCPLCEYKSPRKGHVERHILIHSGEKPYSCGECSYRSHTKDAMALHARVHTGLKKFECDRCSYSTNRKIYLERHLALHGDDEHKVSPCATCAFRSTRFGLRGDEDESFNDELEELFAHDSDSETDIKSVKKLCLKYSSERLRQKDDLETEDAFLPFSALFGCTCISSAIKCKDSDNKGRLYGDERPYPCHQCSYRATKKSLLDKHVKVHTGERPFPCPLCKYRASRKAHLLRHMRTHQKELE